MLECMRVPRNTSISPKTLFRRAGGRGRSTRITASPRSESSFATRRAGTPVVFDGGGTPALRQQEDLALRAADEIAGGGGDGALVLRLPGEAAALRAPVHDRDAQERLVCLGIDAHEAQPETTLLSGIQSKAKARSGKRRQRSAGMPQSSRFW